MSSETTNDSNNKPSSSSDPNRSIELSIKSLEQQVKMVSVPRNASVLDLKHKIEVLFDVDSIRQRLIFQGKVLKDDKNLMDYENLDDGKVIHLVIRPLNAPHNPENDEPQQQRNNRRPTGRRGISSGYAVITLDATLADLTGGLGATSGSVSFDIDR
ncbi:ubiquitin-related domain-containing protein [Cokeromyces recurvatus]|uniref:ubiquitin-related domain-containing protein n=1 Tax=Cokeromyces recurvatus TaxID=90255 RepID=UPI00221E4FBE|nr:ubiquitin-related domain-containing protein [Cokeromyces recurvatus]KAI7901269.1 ubiquitin-related domain-containing protein [Cokeromyces recurvatus]